MLTALAVSVALLQQPAPAIEWRTDLEAARADALQAGRPLLVVFRCEP